QGSPDRSCRCGTPYLSRTGSITRVRHTLSCFLGHHQYEPLADRDGSREYVCVQCGHPLVFRDGHDPYRERTQFKKKVRYLCGLFGHRVAPVTIRDGFAEYACHCGHTFLIADNVKKLRVKGTVPFTRATLAQAAIDDPAKKLPVKGTDPFTQATIRHP